jgi:hypothetical protein
LKVTNQPANATKKKTENNIESEGSLIAKEVHVLNQ